MKRSAIKRTTPLRGGRPLRLDEPGKVEFKTQVKGKCSVCGRKGWVLRHHVITENYLRREGADCWALANGMWVGHDSTCSCHANHTSAFQRIPLDAVPAEARDFAARLWGPAKAADFFARFYAPARKKSA